MPASIFTDKSSKPDEKELQKALGSNYKLWTEVKEYVLKKYPDAYEEWAYPGKSFGWNFRVKDKKRVLVYFKPCDKYFINSFVFGQKATDKALASGISKEIKDTISSAKVYAEGRGFRVEVKDKKTLKDIKKLVDIKLTN